MISPSADDVLAAVIATLEDIVLPAVTDEVAASNARTATQLLRSIQVRVTNEQEVLAADNAELRAVLDAQRITVADPPVPRLPTLPELTAEARMLRAALVEAIDGAAADDKLHAAAKEYLRHSLERQQPWLVEAFTGPRR